MIIWLIKNKVTLGLLANAIDKTKGGSPEAYKTILAVLGSWKEEKEQETPSLNITITDNSNLEKALIWNRGIKMEFETWAVSDNYTKYDQILQKYELKVITTKEKKNNKIHIPYPQYKQKRIHKRIKEWYMEFHKSW